jgi:hypothetical protein
MTVPLPADDVVRATSGRRLRHSPAGLRLVLLAQIEEICTAGAEIHHLGTAVAVLLEARALCAVVCVLCVCRVSASPQVSHACPRRLTEMPGLPQTMQRPPYVPKLHSSQMRTTVAGRTYESQMGLRRRRVSDVRQARPALRRTTCRRTSRTGARWRCPAACGRGSDPGGACVRVSGMRLATCSSRRTWTWCAGVAVGRHETPQQLGGKQLGAVEALT